MKAHINGITVEGTPQEIMEYQRLQAQMNHPQQFYPEKYMQQNWFGTAKPYSPHAMIFCMNMTETE